MPSKNGSDGKIYIEEMAKLLDGRAVHTLRMWIRDDLLPESLRPDREGGKAKIYWTEDQVAGLRQFAAERAARRGWQPTSG